MPNARGTSTRLAARDESAANVPTVSLQRFVINQGTALVTRRTHQLAVLIEARQGGARALRSHRGQRKGRQLGTGGLSSYTRGPAWGVGPALGGYPTLVRCLGSSKRFAVLTVSTVYRQRKDSEARQCGAVVGAFQLPHPDLVAEGLVQHRRQDLQRLPASRLAPSRSISNCGSVRSA